MTPMARERLYWERGVGSVPSMTGAIGLLDGHDVPELAEALGFSLPLGRVIDVGCGTGRIAPHCQEYTGFDISRHAVAYCKAAGLDARPLDAATDVSAMEADVVACMSVFTHIDAGERRDYLAVFPRVARWLLVDIIPGDGSGDVSRWTADVTSFEADLLAAGYAIRAVTTRQNANVHRYYWAEVLP